MSVPRGRLRGAVTASISGQNVQDYRCHVEVLALWPDGSIRWLAIEGVVSLSRVQESKEIVAVTLRPASPIQMSSGEKTDADNLENPIVKIKNACLYIGESPFCVKMSIYLNDARKRRIPFRVITCESFGVKKPVEKLHVRGQFANHRDLTLAARTTHFCALHATLVELTIRNGRRARHRGGLWDLGDPGSVFLTEFGLDIELPSEISKWYWGNALDNSSWDCVSIERDSAETGSQLAGDRELWDVFQASSGGDNWTSVNHIDARGQVRLPFKGFVLRCGKEERRGDRITPLCVAETGFGPIGLLVPRFWEEFPKRITVFDRRIRIALLAHHDKQLHELQGGEQKTFKVWIIHSYREAWHPRNLLIQLSALNGSTVVAEQISPDVPEVLAPLPTRDDWAASRLADFAEKAAFGRMGILANREKVDEFGWRNFGDTYADHEETYYQGSEPLVSHYNNQFDLLYGCILHRLISGDPRWDEIIVPLANHIIDIDIYHTDKDRSTFNHGLFWMTDHYRTAYSSTHRAFSRFNATSKGYGGGPCNEHNYTSGLALYYFLWGDERAKGAVIELANWVMAMEDGSQTPYCILDNGPTGLATMTSSHDYHGPGRGAANSINALLDAWLITGEKKYLEFAEALLRRTIHPDDDIDALDLLNAEIRWSYTMHLEVLAKYLRIKSVFQQSDAMYEYVRHSLVKYAEWMLANERPYLARAEELQYPTEAWAAQDFRKATVLLCASRYVPPEAAAQFREKALSLAEAAWRDLLRFPRPYNVRAAAVILTQGIWHLALEKSRAEMCCAIPNNNDDWRLWSREKFIPQRERVRKKLSTPQGWLTLLARASNPHVLGRFLVLLWKWRN
ncbi:hypothetical protein [Thermogutta sp.]|uniref:RIFT barrel domain-containing protein n=1 Tax=Thermogutta sp. TaxID=1962930 RepID=UPI003C7DF7B0